MLTLERIMKETLWVAKMTYGMRYVGTYEEVQKYAQSEECRDCDIAGKQPEHLKDFYEQYEAYFDQNGWITVPEYYNEVYSKQ